MTVSEQHQVKCEFCENGQCPITMEMAIDAGDRSMAGGTTTCGNCGGDGWVARAEPSRGTPDFLRRIEQAEQESGLTQSQENLLHDLHQYFAGGHVVLLEALRTIADFAVGNGDVCEIIAKRARAAIKQAERT